MKKELEWLYSQLPELVEKGVIAPEAAERMREYYGLAARQGRKTWMTIFGMIGVVLVGLGIILILAHNWEQLTRMKRLLISVGLLAAAQVAAGLVLWRKQESRSWREGAAAFLMLMVGAAMALVGQTYHLSDDTGTFLLTWMALSVPLIYLFESTLTAVFYLAGITAWVLHGSMPLIGKHLIWLLLAAVLPYWRSLLAGADRMNQAVIVTWFFILSLYISFGAAFDRQIGQLGLLLFVALFTLVYLVGVLWLDQGGAAWRRPLVATGLAGTIGLSFVLTFKSIWANIAHSRLHHGEGWLAMALLAPVILLAILLLRRQGMKQAVYVAAPLVAGMAYLLQLVDASGVSSAVVMNIFLLLFGIAVIVRGVGEDSLAVMNLGMILVAALIMARFVDINFSFIVRGLVFVALGITFLTVNWLAARRKAGRRDDQY